MTTSKSDRPLRQAIENLSTDFIGVLTRQGLAFHIILVNALIHQSNVATSVEIANPITV